MCPVEGTRKISQRGLKAGFETCNGLGDKEGKMSTLKMLALAFAKKRDFVFSTPAHSLAGEMTAFGMSACKPQGVSGSKSACHHVKRGSHHAWGKMAV